jgi:SAM-dependent methyltransferase
MRPDDLVEFSLQHYARPESVNGWGQKDLVDAGLYPQETALLERLPIKKGRLLLLGVGGGREAIPLAQMGFEVTGVDFVSEMVEKARENAVRHGVEIEGLVQEISKLEVPTGFYDIVWLSAAMYSCVPTRKKRIEMLRRIRRALRPGGYFVCQFHRDTRGRSSRKVEFARKLFAFLTLGNRWYEKGDMLWGNVEFIHTFSSEDELKSEFDEGGFEVVHTDIPEGWARGGAVLRNKTTR